MTAYRDRLNAGEYAPKDEPVDEMKPAAASKPQADEPQPEPQSGTAEPKRRAQRRQPSRRT